MDRKFCPTCEEYHDTYTKVCEQEYTIEGVTKTIEVELTFCNECDNEIGSDEKDWEIINKVFDDSE